tara:strand:- start:207 stop:623 length:417 start_codon:yes stop_codon:yes gene_type:complete
MSLLDKYIDKEIKRRLDTGEVTIRANLSKMIVGGTERYILTAETGMYFEVKIIWHIPLTSSNYTMAYYVKEKLPFLRERQVAEFLLLLRDWLGLAVQEDPPGFTLPAKGEPYTFGYVQEYWDKKHRDVCNRWDWEAEE